jgi:transcriptional regulator of acetoin/glycerol metabolism
MVKGYDDNNKFSTTDRLLKALKTLEVNGQRNRRRELLRLVKAQYEDLYSRMDAVPHPVLGDRG